MDLIIVDLDYITDLIDRLEVLREQIWTSYSLHKKILFATKVIV